MQTDIDDVFTDVNTDENLPDPIVDHDEIEPEADSGPESVPEAKNDDLDEGQKLIEEEEPVGPDVDSYLCPRFTEGDLTAKPAGALVKKVFHEIWGGSPHIVMPPVTVDTKPGQTGKSVDVLLRKFTHAPLGQWSIEGLTHFGTELWWVHDGLKGLGRNVCAIALARGVELHKVFNFTFLALQAVYWGAAGDPEKAGLIGLPKVGFLLQAGEYRKDQPQFDRAPVLIVNCSEASICEVFKSFAELPARKKGGSLAGLSEVIKFDEKLGEVVLDPSYAPKFPSRSFIDGSELRSSVSCFVHSDKLSREDWMRAKSAVCALFHAKLVGSDGTRLPQSVRAVGNDDDLGDVVKVLMLVSMNNQDELLDLLATLAEQRLPSLLKAGRQGFSGECVSRRLRSS